MPDFISVNNESALSVIQADTTWNLIDKQELRREPGMNLSMPTAAVIPLAGESVVPGGPGSKERVQAIAFKRVDASGVSGSSDAGELVLWLYRTGLMPVSLQELTISASGNRPHVTCWRDHLVVGWDSPGGKASVYELHT